MLFRSFKVFLCLLSTDKGSCRAHHDRLRTLFKDCAGAIVCERLIKGAVNVHLRHLVAVLIFVTAEGLRSFIKSEVGHIADIDVRRLCVFRISDARDHAVIGRRQFRPDTACRIRLLPCRRRAPHRVLCIAAARVLGLPFGCEALPACPDTHVHHLLFLRK